MRQPEAPGWRKASAFRKPPRPPGTTPKRRKVRKAGPEITNDVGACPVIEVEEAEMRLSFGKARTASKIDGSNGASASADPDGPP